MMWIRWVGRRLECNYRVRRRSRTNSRRGKKKRVLWGRRVKVREKCQILSPHNHKSKKKANKS